MGKPRLCRDPGVPVMLLDRMAGVGADSRSHRLAPSTGSPLAGVGCDTAEDVAGAAADACVDDCARANSGPGMA